MTVSTLTTGQHPRLPDQAPSFQRIAIVVEVARVPATVPQSNNLFGLPVVHSAQDNANALRSGRSQARAYMCPSLCAGNRTVTQPAA